MRRGAVAKLGFVFRQADIETPLATCRALDQELGGDRRLAGSRAAFEQEKPAPSQSTAGDIVET